eukprot:340381_1
MPEENKLYVGNLPKSFAKNDLRRLFGHFGDIEELKFGHNKSKTKTAYGFITFKESEHANEAKKLLDKKTINEHSIHVDFARSPNDLIVKSHKNKKKRKFNLLSHQTISSNNKIKRRKLSYNEKNENNKKIPPSRIVNITNIPKIISINELKQLLHKHINENDYQYLIYPSNEYNVNRAWILHKTVENSQNTINKLNELQLNNNNKINVLFAHKLNKMYRIKINNLS